MSVQEQEQCSFQEPESLKEILDLLVKLNESRTLKNSVGQKLLQDVQKYCKDAQKFYQSGSHSGFLSTVFSNAYGIRGSILETTRTFEKYSSLENSHEDHDCVPRALKKCLPKAYAALYFLLFMGSNSLERTLQGGHWSNNNVNGSRSSGTDLFNWLTKEEKTILSGYSATKPLTPGLVKRGFSDGELHKSSDGSMLVGPLKKAVSLTITSDYGSLQNALSYLLLACPWDPSLLGHALCFLSKFCSEVGNADERLKGNFKGYSEELKNVCLGLQSSLTSFVQGSSQSHISAVSQGNSNVYTGVFKDESLDDHCDWLRGNLQNIIQSLKAMAQDCKNWGSDVAFQMGFTAGPFLYGFVPKERTWQDDMTKGNLPKAITPLIESLNELEKALQTSSSVSSSSSSSAGATAGGVFTGILGTGGLGAGAAYATNAFGFQNLITSFISSFLK